MFRRQSGNKFHSFIDYFMMLGAIFLCREIKLEFEVCPTFSRFPHGVQVKYLLMALVHHLGNTHSRCLGAIAYLNCHAYLTLQRFHLQNGLPSIYYLILHATLLISRLICIHNASR
jgi:hypothetical protein